MNDKYNIIIATRKVISKHSHLRAVQVKVENLQNKVNTFKDKFQELFKIGFPSFWDSNGNIISQQNYLDLLAKQRNDN